MNMSNFKEVITQFFEELNIDPMEFTYNEKTKKFISNESFSYSDDDPESYFMVIKMINNIGNVMIGTSDGIKFSERELLGQIMYDNNTWIKL